jgi:RNA polymerase sigma factor (TIGR02999 family)
MDGREPADTTRLLLDASAGDPSALRRMLPAVYRELRRLALGYLGRERADHTLQPTALVHEAYLRLVDQRQVDWNNRAQFLGVAANVMRRLLVNHARGRAANKRGGVGAERVPITVAESEREAPIDMLVLDDALARLAAHDERKARVVELKFFGGLTTDEIASVLAVSTATVEREWSFARAWLFKQMAGSA